MVSLVERGLRLYLENVKLGKQKNQSVARKIYIRYNDRSTGKEALKLEVTT